MNDLGQRGWKQTFACSFAAQILSILGFSFALPFLPFFLRDLGVVDPAQQAWWAGITLAATGVTLAVFAPVWGILADRYGRKKMVLRSMFGGTVVLLLMSYSRNVTDLLIFRFLQGMLTGGFLAREMGVRAPFLAAGMCQLIVAVIALSRPQPQLPAHDAGVPR